MPVSIILDTPHSKPEGATTWLDVRPPTVMTELSVDKINTELLALCKRHQISFWRQDVTKIMLTLNDRHDADTVASEILTLLHTIHARTFVEDQE